MSHSLTRASDFLAAWKNATDECAIATVNGVSLYTYDLQYLADRAAEGGELEDLRLPVQAYNALRRGGIRTIEQLTARTVNDLLDLRNIGWGCVRQIERALDDKGLKLAETTSNPPASSAPRTDDEEKS